MEGYFKVHRKILDSQVFAHQTALKIWIWCLAKVTYKERFISIKIGKGETTISIKPGQFIFGRFKAEEELNIDGSTIYKWIQKFASDEFGMINIESNNQYSIITICNWIEYQNITEEEVTTKEQPSNNGVTTVEQPCNTNNKDKNSKERKRSKREFVKPSIEEVINYFTENGYTKQSAIKAFNHYDLAQWHDTAGKPVLNWKQKMNTVWFKPENEDTSKKMPA